MYYKVHEAVTMETRNRATICFCDMLWFLTKVVICLKYWDSLKDEHQRTSTSFQSGLSEIQMMGCMETIIPHTLLFTALISDLEISKYNSMHGHTVKVVLISELLVTCFPQPAALKTPPVKIKIKQRTPEAHYDAKEWSCTTIPSNAWTMCELVPSELSLLFSKCCFFLSWHQTTHWFPRADSTQEDQLYWDAKSLLRPRSSSKIDSVYSVMSPITWEKPHKNPPIRFF